MQEIFNFSNQVTSLIFQNDMKKNYKVWQRGRTKYEAYDAFASGGTLGGRHNCQNFFRNLRTESIALEGGIFAFASYAFVRLRVANFFVYHIIIHT